MGRQRVFDRRCLSQLRFVGNGGRDAALRRRRQNSLSAISPGTLARGRLRACPHLFPANDVGVVRSLAPGSDRLRVCLRPDFLGRNLAAGQKPGCFVVMHRGDG